MKTPHVTPTTTHKARTSHSLHPARHPPPSPRDPLLFSSFHTSIYIAASSSKNIRKEVKVLRGSAMASTRVSVYSVLVSLCLIASLFSIPISGLEDGGEEFVVTLDKSNFDDVVSNHDFIVVEFYAPWCGHCKKLAPEYEKAASVLKSHDPPIALAKIDASDESNKEIASSFDIKGFPTLKILRNGGKSVQEYKGPRDADGIVAYLKKQSGPASVEIKSAEDAATVIGDDKVVIVGIFSEFSGEEFTNFTVLAEKLRSEYEFAHTLDAQLLPRGDVSVTKSVVRLFKPFDELFVDFQDFHVDVLEKLVEGASIPTVTLFNKDPNNHPYVVKFFNNENTKAMLFLKFDDETSGAFQGKYKEVAESYKGKGISFLLGDLADSQGALQYFGVKEEQAPVIVIQTSDGKKYIKPNAEPEDVAVWMKEFEEGKVLPNTKSEAIPETNNEPVKVVVADTLDEMVFNSGKNVLLEFYAPWCGHCKKLAPTLDEVAVSFEDDPDVVIAKLDGTANDIPQDIFEVKGYPTLYFRSSNGNIVQYDGDRTKEEIIDFIQKNRDQSPQPSSLKDEL